MRPTGWFVWDAQVIVLFIIQWFPTFLIANVFVTN